MGESSQNRSLDSKVEIRFRANRFLLLIIFLAHLVAISLAHSSTWSTLGRGLIEPIDAIEFDSVSQDIRFWNRSHEINQLPGCCAC